MRSGELRLPHPINRQPDRIGELLLGQGQLERAVGGQTRGLHAQEHFAKDMRDAPACVAPPDVGHPFAADRRFDERIDPQGLADLRMFESQHLQRLALDADDRHLGQRLHVVIGDAEIQVLQIDEVAGQLNGYDLPGAIGRQLLPKCQATLHEVAITARRLTLPDDVGGGIVGAPGEWQRANSRLVTAA